MKRIAFLIALSLVCVAGFATTANEYYFTKRNSANTSNQQVTVTPATGQVLGFDSSGNPVMVAPGSGGGSGNVTSVGLTAPAMFNVSGSPVTTAGNIAVTLAPQSANTIFAGPASGNAAIPTFRFAVAADVPNIAESQVTNLTTDLAGKEGSITSGSTSQYWRGDKSWQTLDKTAVGLANVDNTSDVNKPVSTAQATAIAAKADSTDSRFPTSSQKSALAGYLGVPSSGNPYATHSDVQGAAAHPFDVVLNYNGSGCTTTTTGNITIGTNTLVVASTTTFHVGQGILIKGAGPNGSNPHHISTITAISGTTITLAANASATVSGAVVQHDDTAAINAAILAAWNAGGGLVYLSKAATEDGTGLYRCNGLFNGTTLSIISFPIEHKYSDEPRTIRLEGEATGALTPDSTSVLSGVTISCVDAANAGSPYWAAIGCDVYTAATNYSGANISWNNLQVYFDHFTLMVPTDPQFGGIRAFKTLKCTTGNFLYIIAKIAVGGDSQTTSPVFASLETHSDAVGLMMPDITNEISSYIGRTWIVGFYTGVICNEHTRFDAPYISDCKEGVRIKESGHSISGTVTIENCQTYIITEGTCFLNLDVQCEFAGSGSFGTRIQTTYPNFLFSDKTAGEFRYLAYQVGVDGVPQGFCNAVFNYTSVAGYTYPNRLHIINLANDGGTNSRDAFAIYNLSDTSDSSSNAYTLTNHNTVTFTSGKVGNCATFNGTNQYLSSTAAQAQFSDSMDLTVCGWINTNDLTTAHAVTGQFNEYRDYSWAIFTDTDAKLKVYSVQDYRANTLLTLTGPTLTTGTWYFFVAEFCSSGSFIRIKVNNGPWTKMNVTGKTLHNTPSLYPLFIGATNSGTGSTPDRFWNGSIDAMRFYPRVLNDVEVSALYNNGNGLE